MDAVDGHFVRARRHRRLCLLKQKSVPKATSSRSPPLVQQACESKLSASYMVEQRWKRQARARARKTCAAGDSRYVLRSGLGG